MEEESKALIDAVVHEAAAPYRKVAEVVLGYVFLDELEEKREQKKQQRQKNRIDIARSSVRILEHRKVEPDPSRVAPEHVEKIMQAGEDTSIPELQQIFARLLAAAIDPDRCQHFRQEYVDLAKQFEPLDAMVLQALTKPNAMGPGWLGNVRSEIGHSDDEIMVSAMNLERLGLLQSPQSHQNILTVAVTSPRGRQLIRCISD